MKYLKTFKNETEINAQTDVAMPSVYYAEDAQKVKYFGSEVVCSILKGDRSYAGTVEINGTVIDFSNQSKDEIVGHISSPDGNVAVTAINPANSGVTYGIGSSFGAFPQWSQKPSNLDELLKPIGMTSEEVEAKYLEVENDSDNLVALLKQLHSCKLSLTKSSLVSGDNFFSYVSWNPETKYKVRQYSNGIWGILLIIYGIADINS